MLRTNTPVTNGCSALPRLTAVALLAAVLLTSGLTGCGARYGTYDIAVNMDPALAGSSVSVDVVAADETRATRLSGMSVSQYFDPGLNVRSAYTEGKDRVTFNFRPDSPSQFVLKKSDDVWANWKQRNTTSLFILADLPGVAPVAGQPDGRRLALSLDTRHWSGKTITVTVKPAQIDLETPIKPIDK